MEVEGADEDLRKENARLKEELEKKRYKIIITIAVTKRSHEMDIMYFIIRGWYSMLEERDSVGRTPLWWASHWGHTGIVTELLKKGADKNIPGRVDAASLSTTTLEIARARGNTACVTALLEVRITYL